MEPSFAGSPSQMLTLTPLTEPSFAGSPRRASRSHCDICGVARGGALGAVRVLLLPDLVPVLCLPDVLLLPRHLHRLHLLEGRLELRPQGGALPEREDQGGAPCQGVHGQQRDGVVGEEAVGRAPAADEDQIADGVGDRELADEVGEAEDKQVANQHLHHRAARVQGADGDGHVGEGDAQLLLDVVSPVVQPLQIYVLRKRSGHLVVVLLQHLLDGPRGDGSKHGGQDAGAGRHELGRVGEHAALVAHLQVEGAAEREGDDEADDGQSADLALEQRELQDACEHGDRPVRTTAEDGDLAYVETLPPHHLLHAPHADLVDADGLPHPEARAEHAADARLLDGAREELQEPAQPDVHHATRPEALVGPSRRAIVGDDKSRKEVDQHSRHRRQEEAEDADDKDDHQDEREGHLGVRDHLAHEREHDVEQRGEYPEADENQAEDVGLRDDREPIGLQQVLEPVVDSRRQQEGLRRCVRTALALCGVLLGALLLRLLLRLRLQRVEPGGVLVALLPDDRRVGLVDAPELAHELVEDRQDEDGGQRRREGAEHQGLHPVVAGDGEERPPRGQLHHPLAHRIHDAAEGDVGEDGKHDEEDNGDATDHGRDVRHGGQQLLRGVAQAHEHDEDADHALDDVGEVLRHHHVLLQVLLSLLLQLLALLDRLHTRVPRSSQHVHAVLREVFDHSGVHEICQELVLVLVGPHVRLVHVHSENGKEAEAEVRDGDNQRSRPLDVYPVPFVRALALRQLAQGVAPDHREDGPHHQSPGEAREEGRNDGLVQHVRVHLVPRDLLQEQHLRVDVVGVDDGRLPDPPAALVPQLLRLPGVVHHVGAADRQGEDDDRYDQGHAQEALRAQQARQRKQHHSEAEDEPSDKAVAVKQHADLVHDVLGPEEVQEVEHGNNERDGPHHRYGGPVVLVQEVKCLVAYAQGRP
mmetsp:Transcript_59227/g.183946  ORF Transcript_59227/g.183946 Transcript_59227/m.183946 type:complete len:928 (-) Transcript_59227:185-2968(-)